MICLLITEKNTRKNMKISIFIDNHIHMPNIKRTSLSEYNNKTRAFFKVHYP